MNLGEEQRLMRERNSPKGSRSTNRPSVKPEDPSTGYLDQKTADERYKSRQAYNSVEREALAAELRHPSAKALMIRLDLKQRAVQLKGGRCLICGYDRCSRALEFHHRDKQNKEFAISTFIGAALNVFFSRKGNMTDEEVKRVWESVEWELRKCVLLCANCHREVEAGMIVLKGEDGS